jgi:hypothetical protein
MRWNGRERLTGELAAAGVFVVGVVALAAADPAAATAKVSPGMTRDEVAAALGTPGKQNFARAALLYSPRDLSDLDKVERIRADGPPDSKICWDYAFPGYVVEVSFHGPEGAERLAVVDASRLLPPARTLLALAAVAAVCGLAAAEVAYRRRARAPSAPMVAEAV